MHVTAGIFCFVFAMNGLDFNQKKVLHSYIYSIMCRYSSVNQKYENNTADRIVRPNRNEDFTGNMQVRNTHVHTFFHWNYMAYCVCFYEQLLFPFNYFWSFIVRPYDK